jgi:hypothetical protein
LETEERIVDLLDHVVEIGQRLAALEKSLIEAAGADPLGEIVARLNAFDNRLTRLERHLRRPPKFPITVVEAVDSQTLRKVNEVANSLTTEQYVRERGDSDLHKGLDDAMAAFNQRLTQAAAQFCRMRARLAAVEAKQGDAT